MAVPDKKICNILFVLGLIGLTLFKWHDFHLPYFWDELGVYSRAADYQFQHHLSLMPSSVPPELSRGHPLLFTFMNAVAMRLSGEQIFPAHLFCFFISVVLLLAVYVKISKYFDPLTGILCTAIFSVQPLFLAQSGLMLPEISLTLFIFLALCCYYENKFWQFAFFASLAILTKEVAIVLPATVIAYSIFRWTVLRVKPMAFDITALALTISPYLVFGFFLVTQKRQNGWYFFPTHIDSVAFHISDCLRQFNSFKAFVFNRQGRIALTYIIIAGIVIAILQGKWSFKRAGSSFIFLLLLFSIAFSFLSSLIDLYVDRYLTVLILVFSIFAGAAVTTISKSRLVVAGIIVLSVVIAWQNLENGTFNYDSDLGYRTAVCSLQQGIHDLAETTKPGSKVFSNFPGYFAISFPAGGYLTMANADMLKMDATGEYYLLLVTPGEPYQIDTSRYRMTLLKRTDMGYAHNEIFWVGYK